MWIADAVVRLDELLLDRVFQPLVNFGSARGISRYRSAAIPIDLAGSLCLAWLGLMAARAPSPVMALLTHGVSGIFTLGGLAWGHYMIAHSRRWDDFGVKIGICQPNPNRRSYRPFRLAMLAFGGFLVINLAVVHPAGAPIDTVFYTWAMVLMAYLLSCEDGEPRSRTRDAFSLLSLVRRSQMTHQ